MLLAVGVIYGLVEMAGVCWQRQRPFARRAAIRPLVGHHPNRSFPSRHVASAVAMATIAAPAAPATSRLMAMLAVLLAVSRVAAGVHYPSDVLAGALLGGVVGRALRGRA
jgi:undecaprenyl-diphosphatase